ncbi:MAG: FMN-binding negative transcriptional regulator [Gammaproteobacteria bacterium]|nr:FMN-binding negative transcriptional regulator [Gammaproteobacteria bacterium]
MYVPKHFEVTDIGLMHELIRDYPLATLITLGKDGINANHIPFYLAQNPQPYGLLQGHVARSNNLLQNINDDLDYLAIFHGSNTYITPNWYATKEETGKVVPTWNYAVVHVYGRLSIIDEPSWLYNQLSTLTDHNEARFSKPWSISDAPQDFTEKLMASIVGIEMTITKLIGKWKVSQNQQERNQESVIAGLTSDNQLGAFHMADLVRNSPKKL